MVPRNRFFPAFAVLCRRLLVSVTTASEELRWYSLANPPFERTFSTPQTPTSGVNTERYLFLCDADAPHALRTFSGK